MTFIAKHISVSIERSAAEVYEFASNPENLPKWAGGLSGSIKRSTAMASRGADGNGES
jgi:uncharacterized protein YndB with AHSA1/START domain